jgi:hypothetical protein
MKLRYVRIEKIINKVMHPAFDEILFGFRLFSTLTIYFININRFRCCYKCEIVLKVVGASRCDNHRSISVLKEGMTPDQISIQTDDIYYFAKNK